MNATADGIRLTDENALSLSIKPIDLSEIVEISLREPDGDYDDYVQYFDGEPAPLHELFVFTYKEGIAQWGGYLPSPEDLMITFYQRETWSGPDVPWYTDNKGVRHPYVNSIVGIKGYDSITAVDIVLDEYHTVWHNAPGADFSHYVLPYGWGNDKYLHGEPFYKLDEDWMMVINMEARSLAFEQNHIKTPGDKDNALIVFPDLIDGYVSDYRGAPGPAYDEVGLRRMEWQVLIDFFSYDDLAESLNVTQSLSYGGSFVVGPDTKAEDLNVSIPDLDGQGVYAIRAVFTGYNAENTELFAHFSAGGVMTPMDVPATAMQETTVYYNGDTHTIELEGVDADDIVSYAYVEIDENGRPVGEVILSSENPMFLGNRDRDTTYRILFTINRPYDDPYLRPQAATMSLGGAMGEFAADLQEEYDRLIADLAWSLQRQPLYGETTITALLTIRRPSATEISDVTASGYEGLEDGDKHGIVLSGLRVNKTEITDLVYLTVRDEAGNILPGFDNVALSSLPFVIRADRSVEIPLLDTTNGEKLVVNYTVDRGLLYVPYSGAADVRLLKGDHVVGVDRNYVFDGKAHSIEVGNLSGDGVNMGDAAITKWWSDRDATETQTKPAFTQPGEYVIFFEAERALTGASGTYTQSYRGSAKLTIESFDVDATGWSGEFDGALHGAALHGVDWSSDSVAYATDGANFTSAASAGDLPSFSDVGLHTVTLRVTRRNATRDLTAQVAIRPLTMSGISARDIKAFADGKTYRIGIQGIPDGATVKYVVNGVEQGENPGFMTAGEHTVEYIVRKDNHSDFRGQAKVTLLNLIGVDAIGYRGRWDGDEHGITLSGLTGGERVYYRVEGAVGESETNPVFRDIGQYTVHYRVEREIQGEFIDENGATFNSYFVSAETGSSTVVILPLPNANIGVSGYEGTYDQAPHDAVTLSGDTTGITARYYDNDLGAWLTTPPSIRDAGEKRLTVALYNALNECVSIQSVLAVVHRKELTWNLDGLVLDGLTKIGDGTRTLEAIQGTLAIDGVLDGDQVRFSYSGNEAALLTDDYGRAVLATVEYLGTAIDNPNYVLPGEARFLFMIDHFSPLVSGPVSDVIYNGLEQRPNHMPENLTPDVDYRVVGYRDNINAGTGYILVVGLGYLDGQKLDIPFNILPAPLPAPESIPDQAWTGGAVEPPVTISGLTEGVDFLVSYQNNTSGGTATAMVTGIGNYTGTYELTFVIHELGVGIDLLVTDRDWARRAYALEVIRVEDESALVVRPLPEQNEAGETAAPCVTCTSPPRQSMESVSLATASSASALATRC